MSERLRRQDMKRDEVQEWMADAYNWLLDHTRQLIYGVAAVVVAGLVGVLLFVYMQHRETKSQEALGQALAAYSAPIDAVSPDPDDELSPSFVDEQARRTRARELFEAVRKDYGSTEAGALAEAYLGRIAADEGDLATARELWTKFLADGGNNAITASIQLALYSLDRAEGKSEELIATLRQKVEEPSGPVPVDALLNELAVTLEAQGKTEEAEKTYQRLVDEFPSSPYTSNARLRLPDQGGSGLGSFQLGT